MRRGVVVLLLLVGVLAFDTQAWAQTPSPPPPGPTHVQLVPARPPSPSPAPTGPCELGYTCVGPGNCMTPDFWRPNVVCDNATGQLSARDGTALHGDPRCRGGAGSCFARNPPTAVLHLPYNNAPPIGCDDKEPGLPGCPPYVVCSRQEICDAINADIARREAVGRWIGYGLVTVFVLVGLLICVGWIRSHSRPKT